ncbi:MAG: TMEM175 family protein [Bacteroidia bacterium]
MVHQKEYIEDEIRKEFQLERMILFSDAVFAIVITLMAIEIHVPDMHGKTTADILNKELRHLVPVIVAYTGSFFFIGHIWYQHLQIFSLLKDYDKGLVIRNLVMLFFTGFFPFSASLIPKTNPDLFLPVAIYFSVLITCKISQLILNHYILVKRPALRINTDIQPHIKRFKKSRFMVITLSIFFILITLTMYYIEDTESKPYAWWWFFLIPIIVKIYDRIANKKV